MKITHINLAKGFRGGERQTQILIEQLSDEGYIQQLIVRKNSQLLQRCKHIKNLEIIEISKPYIFFISVFRNAKILHAHETKALQLAYFASKFYNIPYIVTRRVDNPIKNNFLNRKLYENASYVVALSHAIQKEIEKVTKKAHIVVIPSAYNELQLHEEKITEIKQRFKNKFLIGHIGALDNKHKGQAYLIKVAKEIEKEYPDIAFLFVGGGEDAAMLHNLAQGSKNIFFEGFVNNVDDYIAALDMFVFPSQNEGLGSILLDVIKLQVPIVASRVGGIVDIIEHDFNGKLVNKADTKALKEAIISLYQNQEQQLYFTDNALQTLNKFSPQSMKQSYIQLYKKMSHS